MSSRKYIHAPATFGQRLADKAAALIGSWRFLIAQSGILAVWILYNSLGFTHHFDSFPYILCNLALSFQAAFTGPVLLIAANRAAQRDRLRDDTEAQEVESLMALNVQQLEILRLLHQLAAASPQPSPQPPPATPPSSAKKPAPKPSTRARATTRRR